MRVIGETRRISPFEIDIKLKDVERMNRSNASKQQKKIGMVKNRRRKAWVLKIKRGPAAIIKPTE